MDINDILILCKHVDEQYVQNLREWFSKFGADYDRGDIIIINENIIPEVKTYSLPKQVMLSPYLPNDTAGIVLNGKEFNKVNKGIDEYLTPWSYSFRPTFLGGLKCQNL